MSTSPSGRLIVISGPSGVGKSTIVNAVLDRTDSTFSVSATTRQPRPGERDGHEYFFVDRSDFEAKVRSEEVLEWAQYGGNLYGTLRSVVLPTLESGRNVILDIENEGAKQIRRTFPEALLIFVAPPNLETLAERLRGRGDTADDDMRVRLGVAAEQMAEAPSVYDHIIENSDLEHAIRQVLDILGGEGTGAPVQ